MKPKKAAALELVKLCRRVLDDKKAEDVVVLDVSVQSSITDYLVVATATSGTHLRALRVELEKALDAAQIHLVGMEAPQESGWIVIDAFDVMVHLFNTELRERYALERLWQDAVLVSPNDRNASGAKGPRSRSRKAPANGRAKKRVD